MYAFSKFPSFASLVALTLHSWKPTLPSFDVLLLIASLCVRALLVHFVKSLPFLLFVRTQIFVQFEPPNRIFVVLFHPLLDLDNCPDDVSVIHDESTSLAPLAAILCILTSYCCMICSFIASCSTSLLHFCDFSSASVYVLVNSRKKASWWKTNAPLVEHSFFITMFLLSLLLFLIPRIEFRSSIRFNSCNSVCKLSKFSFVRAILSLFALCR